MAIGNQLGDMLLQDDLHACETNRQHCSIALTSNLLDEDNTLINTFIHSALNTFEMQTICIRVIDEPRS